MGIEAKVRIEWIDVAKAISILLVTLLHFSQLAYAANFDVWRLVQLNTYLAPIRMPLFFAASGAFAGTALTKPWGTLLRSRVGLYLWLFVLWTVVRWLFCALLLANPMNPTEGSARLRSRLGDVDAYDWTVVLVVTRGVFRRLEIASAVRCEVDDHRGNCVFTPGDGNDGQRGPRHRAAVAREYRAS